MPVSGRIVSAWCKNRALFVFIQSDTDHSHIYFLLRSVNVMYGITNSH